MITTNTPGIEREKLPSDLSKSKYLTCQLTGILTSFYRVIYTVCKSGYDLYVWADVLGVDFVLFS